MQEDDSCDLIAAMFGTFSHDDFKSWNPAVGSDCSGLKVDYACSLSPLLLHSTSLLQAKY